MKIRIDKNSRAFSLVEVVLALGIVSFCLVSIIGLLPVGLSAIKNANDESAAGGALSQLSMAIRNATDVAGSYSAAGDFSELRWTDGTISPGQTLNLAMDGKPTNQANARFVARVQVVAPGHSGTPGKALISIAWPAQAEWSSSSGSWSKSEGAISSGIIFLPKL